VPGPTFVRQDESKDAMNAKCKGLACAGLVVAVLALVGCQLKPPQPPIDPCSPNINDVACENSRPGNPPSQWDSGVGDTSIQGFATQMSVNVGQTIQFKINTPSTKYHIDIYRLGYYQGNGARKWATVQPSAPLPQSQPPCLTDTSVGLVDCGTWSVSASWSVPANAVSGVFIAHLVRDDVNGDNQIPFVVRKDASHSNVIYQTSDTTWQAYNSWGGYSLYYGPTGPAQKVSYNRPFTTRGDTPSGQDYLMAQEYPMIRFLEANGYDISYQAGADTDRSGSLLLNHKVFLSVGHDEYWSGQQRANVAAARDAGVNLAFFSGNEMFWKTRWEPSVDGTNTSDRTLVCYKETAAGAKTDPTPTWTGTWRDPRFSPPSDGGNPENALTGTMSMVQGTNDAMTVPAAEGKLRFWRNTSIANLADGSVGTLPTGVLGYEWDSDVDNGARPPGLFDVSSTTLPEPQTLTDYGSHWGPASVTHSMTEYRAASGALVFSAGDIRWSWGLDGHHDGSGPPPSLDMQQATVNLLADMGAQPGTLLLTLQPATGSTDTTPPIVSVTAPSPGTTLTNGSVVNISGTATDVGGGVVAVVEVSTDGGTTWHRADGTSNWSYAGSMGGTGAESILVRAADDSANLQTTPASVPVTVNCPCSIFGQSQKPFVASSGDPTSVEVGVKFTSQVDGWITGVRFYKGPGNTGTHIGNLWSQSGQLLASAQFVNETSTGWQEAQFGVPVAVTAGTTYVASYFAPNGNYAADDLDADFASPDLGLDKGAGVGPLTALPDGTSGGNGVFRYGSEGFPASTFGATNYWVDAVLATTKPPDTTPPLVSAVTPIGGATSVPTSATPTAIFNEAVQAPTVSFTLFGPANSPVAGTTSYDGNLQIATFTPTSPLDPGTTYTATVTGETDLAGNVQTNARTWSFTTAVAPAPPGVCPCSIWNDGTQPAVLTENDPRAVELGVRFHADQDGVVSGVRFFKGPLNTGVHTGSLWTSSGQLLATATFSGESTTGWQTVTFSSPVPITAGTDYVASYHTSTGNYSEMPGQFAGQGVDAPPLHADADNSPSAPNGVFSYGTGGFPTSSSASTGYMVDVVYTPGPDLTAPSVASTTPMDGETSVPTSTGVSARLSEAIQPATAQLTLTGPGGAVGGTVSYSPTTLAVTLSPTVPLAPAATYTATLSGATDLSGNTMPSLVSWSFTTSGVASCPCTLFSSAQRPGTVDSNDPSQVELGMRFTSDTDGWITGVRFYKSAANTGVHTGTLWDTNGNILATGAFSGETATGWQTLTFATAVPVTAGTTYVVSYYAPNGHYSLDLGFFNQADDNAPLHAPASAVGAPNGVYSYAGDVFPVSSFGASNYWVDPVFSPVAPLHLQSAAALSRGSLPAATMALVERALAVEPSDDEHPR
jgi:hypothetical protein